MLTVLISRDDKYCIFPSGLLRAVCKQHCPSKSKNYYILIDIMYIVTFYILKLFLLVPITLVFVTTKLFIFYPISCMCRLLLLIQNCYVNTYKPEYKTKKNYISLEIEATLFVTIGFLGSSVFRFFSILGILYSFHY